MSNKAIMARFLVALTGMAVSACVPHQKIPASELDEIRQLAFADATKRYVLPDAAIESKYQPRKIELCSKTEENKYKKTMSGELGFPCEHVIQEESRLPAAASVKGVQLSPSTGTLCLVKFDFEPSPNPQAELPRGQGTAERFEKADGSHYWLIVWK